MKAPLPFCWLLGVLIAVELGAATPAPALDDASEVPASETGIPGPIADGTPAPPAPERRLPDFNVRSTTTKKIMREEPSGVPGLPPVRKKVTLSMHLVEDPNLPDPPPPPPAQPPEDMTDPAVLARRAELWAHYQEPEYVFLSATVYDHQRTLVRWWPNRGPAAPLTVKLAPVPVLGRWPNDKPDVEMIAWSNIDFNHLSGFSDYTYKGRKFSLVMGVGDLSTATMEKWAQRSGRAYIPPVFPELPADGPGFVVTKGDTSDEQAMDVITGLHELYKAEGPRLKAAYEAREQARMKREAYLRANPPQPKDVATWISEPKRTDLPAAQTTNPESAR